MNPAMLGGAGNMDPDLDPYENPNHPLFKLKKQRDEREAAEAAADDDDDFAP